MKTRTQWTAGTLLLLAAIGAAAAEPRPGQAVMDELREQTLAQLRHETLAALPPQLRHSLHLAMAAARPRSEVAATEPGFGAEPSKAAH